MRNCLLAMLSVMAMWAAHADDYNDGVKLLGNGQHEAAFGIFQPLALAGDADAQNNLGAMFEHGRGVSKDLTEAAKWYRAAAIQGQVVAQYNLASLLYCGKGVKQDRPTAIAWALLAEAGGLRESTRLIDTPLKRMPNEEIADGYSKFREYNDKYGFQRTPPRPFRLK